MKLGEALPMGVAHELGAILKMAFPLMITEGFQLVFAMQSLIFCGRLGSISLACAALSTSLINVIGWSIALGLSSACDTLYTQTFGSVNRHKLGILVQRSVILILVCLMPCFALHINMERFLLVMGQDPVAAHLSGEYILIAIPGVAAYGVYVMTSKYIQCQSITVPVMLISIIANIICGVMHYILIFYLDMATRGSAWAVTSGHCSQLIITVIYIICSGIYKLTWSGFGWDCFLEWGQFLKFAYSGMFMLGFE